MSSVKEKYEFISSPAISQTTFTPSPRRSVLKIGCIPSPASVQGIPLYDEDHFPVLLIHAPALRVGEKVEGIHLHVDELGEGEVGGRILPRLFPDHIDPVSASLGSHDFLHNERRGHQAIWQ